MGIPLPNVLESFMSLLSGPHFVFQGIKKKLEMKFIPTILWLHGRLFVSSLQGQECDYQWSLVTFVIIVERSISYYQESLVTWWCPQFVGNKAKGQISKWVLQENKTYQIFRKTNITYPVTLTRMFFEKLGVLCSLLTPLFRFVLCLITDELFHSLETSDWYP